MRNYRHDADLTTTLITLVSLLGVTTQHVGDYIVSHCSFLFFRGPPTLPFLSPPLLLTHSLTHLLTYYSLILTHSLTHSLTLSFTHSFTHSLTHSLSHSLSLTTHHSHSLTSTASLTHSLSPHDQ
jgi:hypothetical protein